jgi:hypothetical protein
MFTTRGSAYVPTVFKFYPVFSKTALMRPYSSILQHVSAVYVSYLTNSMRKEYKESDQVMQRIREFDQLLRATGREIFSPHKVENCRTDMTLSTFFLKKIVTSHERNVKCLNMSRDGNVHWLGTSHIENYY